MKLFLILILLVFNVSISLGQNPEQVAVDFYAQKFSKENKEKRIRFDGKIKSYGEKQAGIIISTFHYCKIGKHNQNNDSIKIDFSDIDKLNVQLKKIEIGFKKNYPEKLKIPDNFKYRKKLKYKKLRGGFMNFYADKIWHSVFPHKFNFAVEPSVKFNGFYFVRLAIDKNDSEYGSNVIIKLNKNLKVVDWCKESWIQ